jgi:uncharacterized protein (TIGR03067 family)
MKTIFASVVGFSLVALVGAAAGGDKTPAKLEGTWLATGAIKEGMKIPTEQLDKIMLVLEFKDGKYSASVQGKEIETGTYKADASKMPATLDTNSNTGDEADKVHIGIYKLDGDSLTFAIANPGKGRPKNFDGGPDVAVTMLKRKK